MSSSGSTPSQVFAVLDDTAAAVAALELSSALARVLQRDLQVVYVESARALVAAALPITQVLGFASAQWQPLTPDDVERGFRAHAARLRELAGRIALRHAVSWSLRVLRGSLGGAALELCAECDLLLVAAAPQAPTGAPARAPKRRPVVAVVREDSAAGQRALTVATQLAQALGGMVEVARIDAGAKRAGSAANTGTLAALTRSDVLVLPRAALDPEAIAGLRCPVLVVG